MVTRAREFKTRTGNVIKAINGCKYLVLVGINEEQKSYLNFLNEYNTM